MKNKMFLCLIAVCGVALLESGCMTDWHNKTTTCFKSERIYPGQTYYVGGRQCVNDTTNVITNVTQDQTVKVDQKESMGPITLVKTAAKLPGTIVKSVLGIDDDEPLIGVNVVYANPTPVVVQQTPPRLGSHWDYRYNMRCTDGYHVEYYNGQPYEVPDVPVNSQQK
jgi:hypothetical protein